jgi:hypothetical protein
MNYTWLKPHGISLKTRLLAAGLALAGGILWCGLSLPELNYVHFNVTRLDALMIAQNYLHKKMNLDASRYRSAVVFMEERNSDRFLQLALGAQGEAEFIKKHDYDLFYWKVRLFKEGEKEEFSVILGLRSGEIIEFSRSIAEDAARPATTMEQARDLAQVTLEKEFGIDFKDYEFKDQTALRRDHRTDYSLTWLKRDVAVPWRKSPDQAVLAKDGTAKLLIGAVVTGTEVLSAYRSELDIPEAFNRSLDQEQEIGRTVSSVFSFIYILLVIFAIYHVVNSRYHTAITTTRPFVIKLGIFLFIVLIMATLNLSQGWMMNYSTSQLYAGYWGRFLFQAVIGLACLTAGFVLIIFAGENWRLYDGPDFERSSFLYYIRSSFFTRAVSDQIFLGYMTAIVMLGAQAVIFTTGQKLFHVWSEQQWLTQFSGAYVPALTAMAVGLKTSLSEETTFRLFSFFWFKSITKNILIAAVLSSLIWGFGHTSYLIFPMWFRGIEVTLLGLGFMFVYLRFGLITILTAHYLFDVFWSSAGCLFGQAHHLYFWSAISVLALPAGWALAAYLLNRSGKEKTLKSLLSPAQIFNASVLKTFTAQRLKDGADMNLLKEEFLRNNWDPAVVNSVFNDLLNADV